eukprot:3184787-Amphidinium_carterae.1
MVLRSIVSPADNMPCASLSLHLYKLEARSAALAAHASVSVSVLPCTGKHRLSQDFTTSLAPSSPGSWACSNSSNIHHGSNFSNRVASCFSKASTQQCNHELERRSFAKCF